ncbi:MAG: tripartite tricarboxylate transporter substrate binding protein [Eubacteriales bacterium]|nr:tripartite tricarboxylate transporter substrate binding protein [Eubacteriales bacterium]
MKKVLAMVLAVLMVLGTTSALAADYPTKGITMICPWSAGGGTDSCLRALSLAAEKILGQTITVENKTGGGGLIGHSAIMTAKPDGYTMGMITFELSTYIPQGTGDVSYEDYDLICRVNTDAAALTVNTAWAQENNVTDIDSFVAYCKANPGTVNIGNSAPASVWHIGAGLLAQATGIEVEHVAFEGAAAAVTALAGGHIQAVSVSLGEVRSQVEAGNLTVLGVMDTKRAELFPDVPTFQEQGYDIVYGTWRGLALPKGVDPEIRQILADTFAKAVEDPDFVEFMKNSALTIAYQNTEDFTAFLKQNYTDVKSTMEALGLTE